MSDTDGTPTPEQPSTFRITHVMVIAILATLVIYVPLKTYLVNRNEHRREMALMNILKQNRTRTIGDPFFQLLRNEGFDDLAEVVQNDPDYFHECAEDDAIYIFVHRDIALWQNDDGNDFMAVIFWPPDDRAEARAAVSLQGLMMNPVKPDPAQYISLEELLSQVEESATPQ